MELLVLAPPVCTPAEPPSGAFMLAAGLAGHGREVGLLDLSLELFHRVLDEPGAPGVGSGAAIDYLLGAAEGYGPDRHRTSAGALHRKLAAFDAANPGWKLTLMDIAAPVRLHDPVGLAAELERSGSPFDSLWEQALAPSLDAHRPEQVLISLAYLSQLPATIDLVRYLATRGIEPVVGGSLPRSLELTGHGMAALARVLPRIDTGDGLAQARGTGAGKLLDRLAWPALLSSRPYLSARPIVPLTLSTGCCWRRCLFCPDRELPFATVPPEALDNLLATAPADVRGGQRPIVHLLDSALPPALLRRFLPLARQHRAGFYGFARPTRELLDDGLLDQAAGSGCLMLQLGAESGSAGVLGRYDKGFTPDEAEQILRAAAGAGIRVYLYLLFGLPGETDADRLATLDLVERNAGCVDFLNVSLFNLPRFCELTSRAAELGVELGDFPDERDLIRLYSPFTVDGRSPRDQARAFVKQRFDGSEAVRAARLRTPRWLRAAHLALMRLPGRRIP
jgi:hypothetical protein